MTSALGQRKSHSLLEAMISTLIGFIVAWAVNMIVLPLWGFQVSVVDSFWIAVIFTFVSVLRGYFVRRLFNWMHVKEIL